MSYIPHAGARGIFTFLRQRGRGVYLLLKTLGLGRLVTPQTRNGHSALTLYFFSDMIRPPRDRLNTLIDRCSIRWYLILGIGYWVLGIGFLLFVIGLRRILYFISVKV